jgi:hypothetical protein
MFCFSCYRRFDAIDLFRLATGSDTREAINKLAAYYGIAKEAREQRRPRHSQEVLARAEFFRTGLLWQIERSLSAVKTSVQEDGDARLIALIRELTLRQVEVEQWSTYEAADALMLIQPAFPQLAADCIGEVMDTQVQLACLIVGIANLKGLAA